MSHCFERIRSIAWLQVLFPNAFSLHPRRKQIKRISLRPDRFIFFFRGKVEQASSLIVASRLSDDRAPHTTRKFSSRRGFCLFEAASKFSCKGF
ncbi:hypothetical protein CEXT_803021 [Caerostris extrusa]|uniref:Secreted protein n=1 Tax=Caerostris extrusa TaxID=172846 RepID=A0AAV4WQV7_CAEEX|nr:hypothetical protein CEXT_803021 [Caerostris extrusa]